MEKNPENAPVEAETLAEVPAVETTPDVAPEATQDEPQRDYTAERDEEIIPAAKELLARLAVRPDLKIGSAKSIGGEDSAYEYYQQVYQEDVVPMLRARNVKLNDITYIFQLMMQAVQLLSDVSTNSIKMNRDIGDSKAWGVKDKDDLRIADLDKMLMGDNADTASPQSKDTVA